MGLHTLEDQLVLSKNQKHQLPAIRFPLSLLLLPLMAITVIISNKEPQVVHLDMVLHLILQHNQAITTICPALLLAITILGLVPQFWLNRPQIK